jgi:hypothetical protein
LGYISEIFAGSETGDVLQKENGNLQRGQLLVQSFRRNYGEEGAKSGRLKMYRGRKEKVRAAND